MEKTIRVTRDDLVGDIKDFPIEVVRKMVERQVEQGNPADAAVFAENRETNLFGGGFIWIKSEEGVNFWTEVISNRKFGVFFDKYPNDTIQSKGPFWIRGYKGREKEVEDVISRFSSEAEYLESDLGDPGTIFVMQDGKCSTYREWCPGVSVIMKAFTEHILPDTVKTIEERVRESPAFSRLRDAVSAFAAEAYKEFDFVSDKNAFHNSAVTLYNHIMATAMLAVIVGGYEQAEAGSEDITYSIAFSPKGKIVVIPDVYRNNGNLTFRTHEEAGRFIENNRGLLYKVFGTKAPVRDEED